MKILLVTDSLGSGGAQRQLVNLAIGLKKKCHEIHLFTYNNQDFYKDIILKSGIRLHDLNIKSQKYSLKPPFHLNRLIRTERFDVILSFLPTANIYAILASISLTHTPIIVSERASKQTEKPYSGKLRQFYRLASHVVTNSAHEKTRLTEEHKWIEHKITMISNGLDTNIFRPNPRSTMLDVTSDLNLLAVGRTDQNKNPLGLVRALAVCKKSHGFIPNVSWVGVHTESQHIDKINSIISAESLEGNWKWMGVRKDIPELMRAHDALIHPSLSEGQSNVVNEALSSGLPILAGKIADHPSLIEVGVRGFLFDPNSPEEIASAILKYKKLDTLKKINMAENCRSYALSELSIESYTQKYIDLFNLLRHKPRNRSTV